MSMTPLERAYEAYVKTIGLDVADCKGHGVLTSPAIRNAITAALDRDELALFLIPFCSKHGDYDCPAGKPLALRAADAVIAHLLRSG